MEVDSPDGQVDMVKELHRDLARKYQLHSTKIEEFWRSFDTILRAKALKDGAAEGKVLKDPKDRTMGNVYKIIPEINIRDVTTNPDFLLNILKHRATKTLHQQYCEGVGGGVGDHAFILDSMNQYNLRNAHTYKYSVTVFLDDDQYGDSFKTQTAARYREMIAGLSAAVNSGLCVPQETGELILNRQLYTLQALNILIGDILEIGSTSRSTSTKPETPEDTVNAALSRLSIVRKPKKFYLSDILAIALDQKTSLNDLLKLFHSEPVVTTHAVNAWFFSRPEMIADERGRIIASTTDKYISLAIFELTHNAIVAAATWHYLYRILQLLVVESTDKIFRGILLQEISDVCHLEYFRAQRTFKRHVQVYSGAKYFKRMSNVYDSGVARVVFKKKPEDLTIQNPQLHYILQLCSPETNPSKAVTWITKLDDLHKSHPDERNKMSTGEVESFGDLAVIVDFIKSFSAVLPLPSSNLKKSQVFVSRSKESSAELEPLKTEIDLSNFAVPIDNLLEPGMAIGALDTLDKFIMDKRGATIIQIYEDLAKECLSYIQDYCLRLRQRNGEDAKSSPSPALVDPATQTGSLEFRVQQRRQKNKTRPSHSSAYEICPEPGESSKSDTSKTSPIFKVRKDTFETFNTLFSKTESRGSINWTAFEAAMSDLSFSVMPKSGSVFTFFPPEDMGVRQSITLHRPHKSSIEGYYLLTFASRLTRIYGWGEESFILA